MVRCSLVCARVCTCVRVCVCEREREKERMSIKSDLESGITLCLRLFGVKYLFFYEMLFIIDDSLVGF